MDASSRDRLSEGVLPAFEKAGKTACIDHHITNTGYTDITFVKPEASSTCEVLCGLLEDSYITKETAECLYLGIVHDTGVFKHSNTTEHTMKEAGRMISFGARPEVIIDDTFYKKTFLQNKILGKALERAELYLDGSVIASFLSLEEMEEFGLSGKDLDGIIDQLRVTEAVSYTHLTSSGSNKIPSGGTVCFPLMFLGGDGNWYPVLQGELQGDPDKLFQVTCKSSSGDFVLSEGQWKTWDNGHYFVEYKVEGGEKPQEVTILSTPVSYTHLICTGGLFYRRHSGRTQMEGSNCRTLRSHTGPGNPWPYGAHVFLWERAFEAGFWNGSRTAFFVALRAFEKRAGS